MGSFQSKVNAGPQVRSPRHGSIGGRLRVDSPRISSPGAGRRRSSMLSSLNNKNSNSHSAGNLNQGDGNIVYAKFTPPGVSEGTPLLAPTSPARMLGDGLVVEEAMKAPPLAVWIGPALACALAYALYNIFIKKGSASINPILGGVILQFVAAILGCCLLGGVIIYNKMLDADSDDDMKESVLQWDWTGVQWAVLAGVAVGAAEMISFCVSGMGVQAMQSIPISKLQISCNVYCPL